MQTFLGHVQMIEFLVDENANVNVTSKLGLTPAHFAASKSRDNAIEMLISKGADVNLKDNDGRLPLHLAVENGTMQTFTN